ncbi:MAG TPA: hypothetical protein VLL52_15145 [Anaerolineae bacterium]|nr:hypothetical protein [Anaerolineae bacterium]
MTTITNRLQNGSLNEDFYPYRRQDPLNVAVGWAPWWVPQATDDPQWRNQRPTYNAFSLDDDLVQQLSTPWGTHTGGLMQQVPAAAGNRYELSASAQAWSSDDDKPASKKQASDVNIQIGVDPTGGVDPQSPVIIWSDPAEPLSKWATLRLSEFEAQADTITIYLKSAPSLPRRQQTIFWRDANLRVIGEHRRALNIVGPGDTHITIAPEKPMPNQRVIARVSANEKYEFLDFAVRRPDGELTTVIPQGMTPENDRYIWRYEFTVGDPGLYDLRFTTDRAAFLLAQRLVQVTDQMQMVPTGTPRLDYHRVYILLPPTADEGWLIAAARGSFQQRFTIGFSADDAGVGELGGRLVVAINPHHWPQLLTREWFQHYYPGARFIPVVANKPADLEEWLRNWEPPLTSEVS